MFPKLFRIIVLGMILINVLGSSTYLVKAKTLSETVSFSTMNSLAGKKVTLDPGHGWAGDPGATGNGMLEKDLTLDIARKVKAILEQRGVIVTMTRNGDEPNKTLKEAPIRANQYAANIVVSIHVNSGKGTGTESCYTVGKSTDKNSEKLAHFLSNSVSSQLALTNRGDFPENYASRCARSSQTHWTQLYIHDMNPVAALIETAFIDGLAKDVDILKNKRQEIAQAIALGVASYFGANLGLPIVFENGSSQLTQDQNWGRANLKVCANNLIGNSVYVYFSRAGRSWSYNKKATSTCVIFWDMDGAGPLNAGTTYYSRAALNQPPVTTWPIPCASKTGGQGLCDQIIVPAKTPTKTASPTPILTSTKTITPTPIKTSTNTPTSITATPTATATIQATTVTPTITNTPTGSAVFTATPTATMTVTVTATPTATAIPPFEIQVNHLGAGFTSSLGQARNGWRFVLSQGKTISCSQDAANLIYTQTNNGIEFSWARWTPNLPYAGKYTVYVYIPKYTHNTAVTSSANYVVAYLNGLVMVNPPVNQNNNLCGWTSIGTYQFAAGTSGNVYIENNTSDGAITLLAADAVKFVWAP